MADQKPYYMTCKEVAAKLNRSVTWVLTQIQRGKLPYIDTKHGRLISSDHLNQVRALIEQSSAAQLQARRHNVERGREAMAKVRQETNNRTLRTLTKVLDAQTRTLLMLEQILDALTAPGPRQESAPCSNAVENAEAPRMSLGH